jgi:hypothetical protein
VSERLGDVESLRPAGVSLRRSGNAEDGVGVVGAAAVGLSYVFGIATESSAAARATALAANGAQMQVR